MTAHFIAVIRSWQFQLSLAFLTVLSPLVALQLRPGSVGLPVIAPLATFGVSMTLAFLGAAAAERRIPFHMSRWLLRLAAKVLNVAPEHTRVNRIVAAARLLQTDKIQMLIATQVPAEYGPNASQYLPMGPFRIIRLALWKASHEASWRYATLSNRLGDWQLAHQALFPQDAEKELMNSELWRFIRRSDVVSKQFDQWLAWPVSESRTSDETSAVDPWRLPP